MGNSLQDQLLNAGAISKQKAQKASSHKRKKQRQKNNKSASAVDNELVASRRAQAEKVERDRVLNRQRQAVSEQKAIAAQIKQLIELNCLSRDDGDQPYNFVDGTNIHKIYVTKDVLVQLARGLLSIVRSEGGYEIIPAMVAAKINERDDSIVISGSQADTIDGGDDPYADYQVPDDLMW